jgi:hypothetical protein
MKIEVIKGILEYAKPTMITKTRRGISVYKSLLRELKASIQSYIFLNFLKYFLLIEYFSELFSLEAARLRHGPGPPGRAGPSPGL